jgi:hypothetical protein
MDTIEPAQAIFGDHLGVLYSLLKPRAAAWSEASVVHRHGAMDKGHAVNSLSPSVANYCGDAQSILASRANGGVTLHSATDCTCLATVKGAGGAPVIGADWLDALARPRVLSVHQDGCCCVHDQLEGSTDWTQTCMWQASASVQCFGLDWDRRRAAVGGQGTELSVWDVETGECRNMHRNTTLALDCCSHAVGKAGSSSGWIHHVQHNNTNYMVICNVYVPTCPICPCCLTGRTFMFMQAPL